jgi:hypothetical protein
LTIIKSAVLKNEEKESNKKSPVPAGTTVVRVLSMILENLAIHDRAIARTPHSRRRQRTQHSTVPSSSITTSSSRSTIPVLVLQDNNKKEERRVSIDERVQVRRTIARHEMSKEEIHDTWYSLKELHQITESCCKQIIKLNSGETLKDKKYCARGLESFTFIRSIAKSMNRHSAHQVVFEEQERQLETGIHNDETVSRLYLAASSGSCLWANVIGLQDQKEADNFIDDE